MRLCELPDRLMVTGAVARRLVLEEEEEGTSLMGKRTQASHTRCGCIAING